jgi:DNA-binding transcriptional LysR family regulator
MLGVNHSTVFRRINAIERDLEVRLFDRQADGYVMTEAGEAVQRAAQSIEDHVHDLTRELLGRDLRLEGRLRITSPEGVAIRVLTPLLGAFCAEHPGIQIDLNVTSDLLRLSRREADVAVRVTRKPPDNLIGRRICRFRFALYASRAYLENHGDADLQDHRWILTEESFEQLPPQLWKKNRGAVRIVFTSNSAMVTVAAVKRGLGVAPLPCFLGDQEQGLVRMSPPLDAPTMDLWILTHPDLRNTARVKALMHYLVAELEKRKTRFEATVG